MKRRRLLVCIPALIVGSLSLSILRTYRLELVYTIALNATLQKAPESYPGSRIQSAFEQSWNASGDAGTGDQYLAHLLNLSARLEKVQSLSSRQVEAILRDMQMHSP